MSTVAMSSVRTACATVAWRARAPREAASRRVAAPRAPRPRRVSVRASGENRVSPASPNRTAPPIDAFVVPGEPFYPGMYADWSVTEADTIEVWSYRVCLSTVALATLACASPLLLGADAFGGLAAKIQEPAYFAGAAGLGAALHLIHMYVDPIKKFMQALWLVGFIGSVGVALSSNESVPLYVAHHPAAVWAIGPLFAAFTGVAFKEGMCYGKPECAALFFVVPLALLGHLTGTIHEGGEKALVTLWCVLIVVFASRKYTQAVKDDIGDKSVFIFADMSDAEQNAWLLRTRDEDPQRYARLVSQQQR
jgi:uncharacterized integral membrane protein